MGGLVRTDVSVAAPAGARRPRRAPDWVMAAGVAAVVAAVMTIPFLQRHDMYYIGDNPESFVPLWHHFGEQLRAGHWPAMDPAGWYGGNYAAEGTYALWNPVQLLDYVLVSLFDDLAAAAALVQVQFLALLGTAAYLLFREYGAARWVSAAIAVGVPATGFTVYYEAAGWPAGLMAFTWVTWFWWAARRHARGHLWPVMPFLFGALGMTTGNPYAALGIVVILAGVAMELLVQRAYGRLGHLVVVGLCVGATAALVFLPLVNTLPVTDRGTIAMLRNDSFLVPHLQDIVASSAPTYLPPIINWNGAVLELVPSTYFLWFAAPILPWLRWGALRRPDRPLTSLAVITVVFGAMSVGPSNVWLFRWPIRLIEYFYLGLAVLLALAISHGLARDHVRRRSIATAGVVAAGAYLSWAVRPDLYRMHLVAGAGALVLVITAAWAFRRFGARATAAVLVLGTALVVTYQTKHLPVRGSEAPDVPGTPTSIDSVEDASSSYRGTVLQLASQAGLGAGRSTQTGELLFGNQTLMSGHESVVRYSGMSFEEFSEALCIDYRGIVCPDAFNRIWLPVGDTGATLVDLVRAQTLVLDAQLFPDAASGAPRPGWTVAERDSLRVVWVRDAPSPYSGRLSWVSPGVTVRSDEGTGTSETVSIDAADDGSLVFARLAWPGYSARLDGAPIDVQDGAAGLLTVDVPAGQHRLTLQYRSPGLSTGALVFAVAAAVSLAQTVLWTVLRWRRRPSSAVRQLHPGPPAGTPVEEVRHGDVTPVGAG
jgi:hypothetical protein